MSKSWLHGCSVLIHALSVVGGRSIDGGIQYRVEAEGKLMASCVRRVTRSLFEPSNGALILVSGKNLSRLEEAILRSLESEVRAVRVGGVESVPRGGSSESGGGRIGHVILASDAEGLGKVLKTEDLHPWAEYLMVTRGNLDHLEGIAASLADRGFAKFAFLTIERNTCKLSSLDPETKVLSSLDLSTLDVCSSTRRIPSSFSSCRCSVRENRGFSVGLVRGDMTGSRRVEESKRDLDAGGHVVNFFAERFGLSLERRSLENWTQGVEAMARGELDVLYGTFVPDVLGPEQPEVATWFAFDKVIFFDLVHVIRSAPLTKIFYPLDLYVWLCTLSCFVAYWILAAILRNFRERRMIAETIRVFDVWAILLSQPVKNPRNVGLRGVLSLWIITALLINAAYCSAFKSSLATLVRLTPLDNVDDVNSSGRRVFGAQVARRLFRNSNVSSDRLIHDSFEVVPPEEVFPVAIRENGVGVDYDLNVHVHNLVERSFRTRLYILKEPILVLPLNFYLKKRHPCLGAFRRLVIRARAAGLVQKWHLDKFQRMRHSLILYFARFKWNYTATLRQWAIAFKILGAGNALAFLTFLGELYKSRKTRSKKKQTPLGRFS